LFLIIAFHLFGAMNGIDFHDDGGQQKPMQTTVEKEKRISWHNGDGNE